MGQTRLPSGPSSIEEHIITTYGALRHGIGYLAIALPVILAVWGIIKYGLPLQDSISAYYHAFVPTAQPPRLLEIAGNGVIVMWVFPLVVALLEFFHLRPFGTRTVFFVEVAGIWTFAAYWLLKSRELDRSKADFAAVNGELERTPRKLGAIRHWLDTTPAVEEK